MRRQYHQLAKLIAENKGMAAEERIGKKLVFLSIKDLVPADLILGPPPSLRFGPFTSAYNHVFQLAGGTRVAVDIYCQAKGEGPDLVVEVKDWKEPGRAEIHAFAHLRQQLSPHLRQPTFFLFHSEEPLGEELQEYVTTKGLWYSDRDRLKDL